MVPNDPQNAVLRPMKLTKLIVANRTAVESTLRLWDGGGSEPAEDDLILVQAAGETTVLDEDDLGHMTFVTGLRGIAAQGATSNGVYVRAEMEAL